MSHSFMLEDASSKRLRTTADSSSTDIESIDELPPNPIKHKNIQKIALSSNLQASLTLFKSFIGTGVLALPFAFKTAGVGLGTIGTLIISLMLTHCFLLLLQTADDRFGRKKASFQKLAMEILGEKSGLLVQIPLIIEQLGCCIGILIFTKDFLNHVLCNFNVEYLCDNTTFNILFALILTVPLSLINNMHYFYIPSLAANFFIIAGLITQMFYNYQVVEENPEVKSTFGSTLSQFHFSSFHLFFGVALFSFEGVGVTFSIRDSMEKPEDLPKLLKNQMVVLGAVYVIFSMTSCLVLGDRLEDIIFFTLPTNDPFYLLIQILYAVSALFTYPIQLFPAVRIIENSKALKDKLFTESGKEKNKTLRYVVRLSIIAVVFLIAYSASSFHLFLNLLGSCVFTFLGFVLPILLYTAHFKGRVNKQTKIANITILVVTIFFGVIGFVSSLGEFFSFQN